MTFATFEHQLNYKTYLFQSNMVSIPINLKVEIKKYKEEEIIDIKNHFLPAIPSGVGNML
jgi:hypothetical protein